MIVRLDGLTKRFPVQRNWRQLVRAPFGGSTATVVDNVSFDVAAGEIFGLLGQNGAGKTTLFKMLSTLILPDDGDATIDGFDVRTQGEEVRHILAPVIANERSLYWRLSARENLRLYATLQGLRGAAGTAEVDRVLGVTGLSSTGEKMVGQFSSGMRQRLLIARALLAKPRVLLLDEPTRSLDPISARDFRRFLREVVVGEEGCTVLLATHDADEVWELCDRVGVLERGRLLAVDGTDVMRHRAGSDRYAMWLRALDADSVVARAAAEGVVLRRRGETAEPGWDEYECDIAGGVESAARVLAALASGNERIARFERATPSLADLIERVVAAEQGGVESAAHCGTRQNPPTRDGQVA
ncbi:MAG TPA: ABC transporter ATP-binding protein [Gemmatimonadaceae bacterium]|nr:ABC transporter ATP-binding protein [Gemmatimonadaceae bacterium]